MRSRARITDSDGGGCCRLATVTPPFGLFRPESRSSKILDALRVAGGVGLAVVGTALFGAGVVRGHVPQGVFGIALAVVGLWLAMSKEKRKRHPWLGFFAEVARFAVFLVPLTRSVPRGLGLAFLTAASGYIVMAILLLLVLVSLAWSTRRRTRSTAE